MKRLLSDFNIFLYRFLFYLRRRVLRGFFQFERGKGLFVGALYQQRGRLVRPFLHSSMGVITAMSLLLAPVVAQQLPQGNEDPWQAVPAVLSAETENPQTATLISDKPRDRIIEYTVQSGDTVGVLAQKFGISEETILWANNLSARSTLKPGQTIQILPVSGIAHKVGPGDTIYSIAKKYTAEPQAIVDFPFNTFTNDETFALAVGQIIVVPDGAPPKEAPAPLAQRRRTTPDAGTVTASGTFIWPVSGNFSQGFAWYHRGIDIANKAGPDVLAADSGTVVFAGCVGGGYGCHVIIDHENGYKTLYGHFSQIYVAQGQRVARGNAIGKMGSTGRSTGTHLHFEIIQSGVQVNPLSILR